jgi:hypothetical protein
MSLLTVSQSSRKFTHVWNDLFPFIGTTIKEINSELREKYAEPIHVELTGNERRRVGEKAFYLLASQIGAIAEANVVRPDEVLTLLRKAHPCEDFNSPFLREMLLSTIRHCVWASNGDWRTVQFEYEIPGCGSIESGYADLFIRSTLWEVKARAEEDFDAQDIRQLLLYAALYEEACRHRGELSRVQSLGLVNTRKGLRYSETVDGICQRIAGKPSSVLLGEVIEMLTPSFY